MAEYTVGSHITVQGKTTFYCSLGVLAGISLLFVT